MLLHSVLNILEAHIRIFAQIESTLQVHVMGSGTEIGTFQKVSASGDGGIDTCQIPIGFGSREKLILTGLNFNVNDSDKTDLFKLYKRQRLQQGRFPQFYADSDGDNFQRLQIPIALSYTLMIKIADSDRVYLDLTKTYPQVKST